MNKNNILQFPDKMSERRRINKIIQDNPELGNNRDDFSPKGRVKMDYELEDFLGMPYGILSNYREIIK